MGMVPERPHASAIRFGAAAPIAGPWRISFASAADYPVFAGEIGLNELVDVSTFRPSFAGSIRYEADFALDSATESALVDLGSVGETAEVFVNGERLGLRICPPYRFGAAGLLRAGMNHICIEITTTLVREAPDPISLYMAMEPVGLLGPVSLSRAMSE